MDQNKQIIILVVVVILVVLIGVQSYQISEIKESIYSGEGFSPFNVQGEQSKFAQQQSVPEMVGGC